jgi:hypothetical protein
MSGEPNPVSCPPSLGVSVLVYSAVMRDWQIGWLSLGDNLWYGLDSPDPIPMVTHWLPKPAAPEAPAVEAPHA